MMNLSVEKMHKRLSWQTWLFCSFFTLTIGGIILSWLLFLMPTNSRDNRNPVRQAEMMQLTLEWGRLAPFPTNAENVSIQTEGNQFTRSFRAKFTAPKEAINRWIAASPGLREAKIEETVNGQKTYVIPPGGGANYAEVIIDFDSNEVEVYVSWS